MVSFLGWFTILSIDVFYLVMFENIIMHWNKLLTREWFSADIFKERFNPF